MALSVKRQEILAGVRAKPIHRAGLINKVSSEVSPLCARIPRALNLRFETWTIRDEDATCQRCRRLISLRARQ